MSDVGFEVRREWPSGFRDRVASILGLTEERVRGVTVWGSQIKLYLEPDEERMATAEEGYQILLAMDEFDMLKGSTDDLERPAGESPPDGGGLEEGS